MSESTTQTSLEFDTLTDEEKLLIASVAIAYYIRHYFPAEGIPELVETLVEITEFYEERKRFRLSKKLHDTPVEKRIHIEETIARPSFSIFDDSQRI